MMRIIGIVIFAIIVIALFKFLWKAAVVLIIVGGAYFLYDKFLKDKF